MTLHVGAARIDRVEEQQFDVPVVLMVDDEAFLDRRIAPIGKGFLGTDSGSFRFTCQSWILHVDGLTVLVDPCNGNGRTGRPTPAFNDSDLPYLERLEAIGVSPASVDIVFCAHLHNDHAGWNTQWIDGAWVPTFPNADYVFVDAEYARWDPDAVSPNSNDFNPSVFEESVRPIVQAGLATIVTLPYQVSPSLSALASPGHTVGHAMLRLTSDGDSALFVGDVIHHPCQVFRPDLHLPGCDDLTMAISTRRRVLSHALAEGALVFPAHFPSPHYGSIAADDEEEFRFVPGDVKAFAPASG